MSAPEERLWKHALVFPEILALSTRLPGAMMKDILQEVLYPELNALLDYFTNQDEATESKEVNSKLRRLFNVNMYLKAYERFLQDIPCEVGADANFSLTP